MHQVLKAFPCSFDGIRTEMLQVGDRRDFGSMAEGLKDAKYIGDIPREATSGGGSQQSATELRDDGPTVAEYVAAGYKATDYPPYGYASRSSAEEIAAAVTAEEDAGIGDDQAKWDAMEADLAKQTVAQLREIVAAEGIELAADDSRKDEIIAKIVAARRATAASEADAA